MNKAVGLTWELGCSQDVHNSLCIQEHQLGNDDDEGHDERQALSAAQLRGYLRDQLWDLRLAPAVSRRGKGRGRQDGERENEGREEGGGEAERRELSAASILLA